MIRNIKEYWIFWVLGSVLVVCFVVMGVATYQEQQLNKHDPCVEWHMEYQAPVYIKSGAAMVPVGGGDKKVCDVRESDLR